MAVDGNESNDTISLIMARMQPIQFGTDGWRGVIADDFTFHRVAVVCEAIGEYLASEGRAEQGVAIGYDNRFASAAFAHLAATMLTRRGIPVQLSLSSLPTPVLSFTIQHQQLGGGIMITASHNSARYNGVLFKPWFAGPAPDKATRMIEQHANALLDTLDVSAIRQKGPAPALLTREEFISPYLAHTLQYVNANAIRMVKPRLLVDPMHGAANGVLDRALQEVGCYIQVLHGEYNPGFGGLDPDPIESQLSELIASVPHSRVDGAVATDGDGDRLGAVTEHGEYVSSHQLFALLLMHLVEDRGLRGGVVKTLSTSTMIGQLSARYGLPLYETPIGFKYIAQLMLEDDILIGGEESGGIGVRGHIPERDATLAALLLIEMMAWRHTTLSGLLEQLRERVGAHYLRRIDLALQQTITSVELLELRRQIPARIHGISVTGVNDRDGVKVLLLDGSWLLLRASGTEPVLRLYAEAETPENVQALLNEGVALITALGVRKAA